MNMHDVLYLDVIDNTPFWRYPKCAMLTRKRKIDFKLLCEDGLGNIFTQTRDNKYRKVYEQLFLVERLITKRKNRGDQVQHHSRQWWQTIRLIPCMYILHHTLTDVSMFLYLWLLYKKPLLWCSGEETFTVHFAFQKKGGGGPGVTQWVR